MLYPRVIEKPVVKSITVVFNEMLYGGAGGFVGAPEIGSELPT